MDSLDFIHPARPTFTLCLSFFSFIAFCLMLLYLFLKLKFKHSTLAHFSHFSETVTTMKFLVSSFSALPSSTISSLDDTMYDSKGATAGCIVGVVRRLLCSSSLPTYLSDHVTEDTIDKSREFPASESIDPGIVARLMGLDSMPKTDSSYCQQHPTTSSLLRSRSLNSLNESTEFDHKQGMRQRAKTSLSFREMPVFLEPENDEFFILSFENRGKARELKSKGRKSNKGKPFGKGEDEQKTGSLNKQRVRGKVTLRSFEIMDEQTSRDAYSHSDSEMVDQSKHVIDSAEVCSAVHLCKQTRTHHFNRKEMSESSSEESSPVSILDFNQKLDHLDAFAPEGNSRRKLSPERENCKQPSISTTTVTSRNNQQSDTIKGKLHETRKQNYDMWCEIQALTNLQMKGSQNWGYRDSMDVEDMVAQLGSHILDLLLNELVDQLVFSPYKIL